MRRLGALAALILATAPGRSGAQPAEATVALAPTPPAIDGEIGDDEWRAALRLPGFVDPDGAADGASALWIAHTRGVLHVAVHSTPDPVRGVLARAHPRPDGDALVGLDDSVHLWLAPGTGPSGTLYRISFNAMGAVADARYRLVGGRLREETGWQSGAVVASRLAPDRWDAELRWSLPDPADTWRLRVARTGQRPLRRSGWPGPSVPSDPLAGMAQLRFEPGAPVAQLAYVARGSDPPGLRIEVANPGRAAVALSLALEGGRGCPPPRTGERVKGGERLRVDVAAACLASSPRLSLRGEKASPLLALPLHAAASTLALPRPWAAELASASLQIAYYPYPGKLRVRFDGSTMPSADSLRSALLVVRDTTRGEEVLRAPLPLADARGETVLDLGSLRDGDYVAEARLRGDERAPDLGSLTRAFSRHAYAWEGNRLGETDRVIPPFTPLRVAGERVDAVLRQHELNDLGLWEQVSSDGVPLLAGPMRVQARVDGRNARPSPTRKIRIHPRGESEVETDAEWTAGRLRARVTGRFEMDGMYRVELALSGPPGTRVEQLDLVLPLRAEVATLMNAITDRVRHHRNGAIPGGRGEVWNSGTLQQVEIPPNFAPYLWLGDERRGLAWFAESTRDWWVAPNRPLQTIRRDGGSVSLVVRLVTRPAPLGRDRTLVFGLQATPTRPVALEDPDRWQFTCGSDLPVHHLCILASSLEFGGATAFGDVYPRNRDETILRILAKGRRSGRQDPAAVMRWIDRVGVPADIRPKTVRSLDYSSRMLAHRPDVVAAYLNTHGRTDVEELTDFQDEWRPRPFGRPVAGVVEAGTRVSPTRSRQDFVLWYQDRLLASGAIDGAYFDNVFMVANFDEIVGGAYRDEEGHIQPAVDLFGVRELLKRSQILSYQRRGRWTNVSHMTTAPIAPINTWAAAILDGEWKYGRDDFQDRFPRDMLRAESLGTQTGSIPVYLPGIVGPRSNDERDHLERSLAGVTAVHGINVWDHPKRALESLWTALYAFGYGQPGTAIHHYWDPDPPFTVAAASGDAEAVVANRDGDAIALVASFGGRGPTELRLDRERLGLARGSCYDAETNRPVETVGPGVCRFPLAKNEYRVVRYGRKEAR
jgi:hypothetical protein